MVGKIVFIGVYLNGPGAGSACMSITLIVCKLSLKTISIVSELVPVIPRFAKSRIIRASWLVRVDEARASFSWGCNFNVVYSIHTKFYSRRSLRALASVIQNISELWLLEPNSGDIA